ncbi:MAG: hypothetical protein ACHQKY_11445 [Terriglobia bacterium]
MKSQRVRIFLVASVLFIMGAEPTHGQNGGMSRFQIPFQFTVGDNIFPPGEYAVTRHLPNFYQGMVRIQKREGDLTVIIQPLMPLARVQDKLRDKSTLVFTRYGNQSFLSEVWLTGDSVGRRLVRSPLEQELALGVEQADRRGEPEKVVLCAGDSLRGDTESGIGK